MSSSARVTEITPGLVRRSLPSWPLAPIRRTEDICRLGFNSLYLNGGGPSGAARTIAALAFPTIVGRRSGQCRRCGASARDVAGASSERARVRSRLRDRDGEPLV